MMGNNEDQSHEAEQEKPKGPGNTVLQPGGGGGKQTGYRGSDYDDMFRRPGNMNTAKGGGANDRYLLSNYYDYYDTNGGSPYKDYYYYQEVANQRSRNRNGWNNGRANERSGSGNNGGGKVPQKASAFFGFNDGTDRQWGWADKSGLTTGGGGQQSKQPSQGGREGGQEVAYQPPSQSTNQGARKNQFLPRQRAGVGHGGAQMPEPTRPPGSDHPPPPPGPGAPKQGGGINKQTKLLPPHRPRLKGPGPRKLQNVLRNAPMPTRYVVISPNEVPKSCNKNKSLIIAVWDVSWAPIISNWINLNCFIDEA